MWDPCKLSWNVVHQDELLIFVSCDASYLKISSATDRVFLTKKKLNAFPLYFNNLPGVNFELLIFKLYKLVHRNFWLRLVSELGVIYNWRPINHKNVRFMKCFFWNTNQLLAMFSFSMIFETDNKTFVVTKLCTKFNTIFTLTTQRKFEMFWW